ncbi:hypothetical protein [Streptomyces sioyaensis]|uniref:hypothetical protein n=1 Tax=Streptomyces sioyaensis TaxID=67364 RepID=UPI0036DFEB6B
MTTEAPAVVVGAARGVTHLRKQVDVANCLTRIFQPLLRLLPPAPGRHRQAGDTAAATTRPRALPSSPSQCPWPYGVEEAVR